MQADYEVWPRRWLWHQLQVTVESSSGGSMRFRIAVLIGILLAFAAVSGPAASTPLLAHLPTANKTEVVFAFVRAILQLPPVAGDCPEFAHRLPLKLTRVFL